jgi:hypothetical protein
MEVKLRLILALMAQRRMLLLTIVSKRDLQFLGNYKGQKQKT